MKRAWILALLGLMGSGAAEAGAVRYEVEGKPFEGYYLAGADKQAPLVVLVHDWDGLNGYEIKRAEMLVALGYSVFAVDLFGAGVRPSTVEDKKRLTGALYQDRPRMRTLLQGGLAEAGRQGGRLDNAVALGYCFGGAAVLELARSGADLKGVVSVHGGLETPAGQDYKEVKGQLLVQHGSADEAVSLGQFAALVAELESAGVKHEATSYSGAPHAFSVFGSDNYRADADAKSWQRFTGFLKEVTGS
ncbi:dienelactone hydrolase family protein [Aeromonas caviae]|uniref:dienelactone hydrolase family protein n=1 Tax=Aeromonas caviae TaxID=648 RepID=UPI00191F2E21|nr:dienelactone hydrolase family protein [Aeromonas caviae]MBL0607781.1 dienelactone hydrolase family protein [Aeromonas caviae]MBL0654239.1 dienelactone hydrolase family protein [Aeromonas caviae]MDN6869716.1 dienelactone hydrolase family protein [Aeromonas caviae]